MRLFSLPLAALLLLGALSPLCLAQNAPPPSARDEQIRQMMESTANPVVPSVARMADAVLDAELRFAERPDTAVRIAAFKRNLFESLQKRGFTAEQAMQIVLHTPMPSTSSGPR